MQSTNPLLYFYFLDVKFLAIPRNLTHPKKNEDLFLEGLTYLPQISNLSRLAQQKAELEKLNDQLEAEIGKALEESERAAREAKEMKKKAEAAQEKSRLDALAAEKARKEALEAIKVSEAIRAAAEKAEEDLRRTQAEMDQRQRAHAGER